MATSTRHRDISRVFLDHAENELKKGDLLQASEKAWGAISHYVKSVAKEQGWPDDSHADVNRNARRLINLTDDPDANRLRLITMNTLHVNFYEEDLDGREVELGVEGSRKLIGAMEIAEARLAART